MGSHMTAALRHRSFGSVDHWKLLSIHTDPDMVSYQVEKKGSQEKRRRERVPVSMSQYEGVYFTWRQSQCMLYFLDGLTQQEVAGRLGISLRTIERYTKDMCMKMKCRDKGHLINTVCKTEFRQIAEDMRKLVEQESEDNA